jgi:hypothetical protein
MAQVFSVNAVGYVKVTVAPNSLALLANPLNQPNNDLNLILPLADDGSQDSSFIFRFNSAGGGSYRDAISWNSLGAGNGGFWSTADPLPNPLILNPGEGFFFQNLNAGAVDLTFVGEVMQGNLSNPIPGVNALSIRASQVPQAAALGDPGVPASLQFPATDGDTVFVFDVPSQQYLNAYTYNGTAGQLGGGFWSSLSDPSPTGPVIPVAGSFFVVKDPNLTRPAVEPWTRTFSVN